ncbi:MAG: hypothetical protein WDN72_10800 [Alphaproteobacteria bacterium]
MRLQRRHWPYAAAALALLAALLAWHFTHPALPSLRDNVPVIAFHAG